jgi:predicted DNA binding protein
MHKDCHIVPRCKKFNIVSYAYPTSSYKKNGKKFVTAIHFIQGKEKNKKEYFKDLKKDKRIKNLEISGNIYSYEVELGKKGEHVQLYYNPALSFVKPVVNHYSGFEFWEVACFDKKILMKFANDLEKHMDYFEILKINDEKLKDIYFPNVLPSLSKNQKEVIELAYKRGYYSYPKKVDLKTLAKEFDVSVPTFQEHLRKAEIKLLPFIIEQNI